MSTDFAAGEGGRGSQGDLNIYCRFPGSLDVPPERRSLFLSLSSQVFFLLLRCLSLTPVPRWYFLVIASSASFFASWTPSFAVAFIASYTWNPAVPFILSLFLFLFFRQSLKLLEKNKQKKTSPRLFLPGQQMSSRVLGKHIRGFDSECSDGQVDASRQPEFSVLKEQQKVMFYKYFLWNN